MSTERNVTVDALASLLASALGHEKSKEVVSTAARGMDIVSGHFSHDEARAIMRKLAEEPGLVGVVARFAISRGEVENLLARTPSSRKIRVSEPGEAAVDIMPLLAPAIGVDKARDATEAAAHRLGLDPKKLDRDGAIAVLDALATQEGIVGVVARFAKARFLLS